MVFKSPLDMDHKTKSCNLKIGLITVVIIIIVTNIPVVFKQGINFRIVETKVPLYVKVFGFICRDHYYKTLLNEIILDKHAQDGEKLLRIFLWTHKNIRPVPAGFPVIDDHILNIIIRGYGTIDQSSDVFCTLCEYAGIPAQWSFLRFKKSPTPLVLSFVKIKDKWRVFDPYFGNFFLTSNGDFAAIEDLIKDLSLVDNAKNTPVIDGVQYKEYFKCLAELKVENLIERGKIQKPWFRIIYEIKKVFKVI